MRILVQSFQLCFTGKEYGGGKGRGKREARMEKNLMEQDKRSLMVLFNRSTKTVNVSFHFFKH